MSLKYYNGTEWVGGEQWVQKPGDEGWGGSNVFLNWTWMTELPDISFANLYTGPLMFQNSGLINPGLITAPVMHTCTSMFEMCKDLTELKLNLPMATSLGTLAQSCTSLRSAEVAFSKTADVSSITAPALFRYCSALQTAKVDFGLSGDGMDSLNLSGMFTNCSQLQTVSWGPSGSATLDLSSAAVATLAPNLSSMFSGCSALSSVSLNIQNASNIGSIFKSCTSLRDISLTFFGDTMSTASGAIFKDITTLNNLVFSGFKGRSGGAVASAPLNMNNCTNWGLGAWGPFFEGLNGTAPSASSGAASKTIYCGALMSNSNFRLYYDVMAADITAKGWIFDTTTTTLPTS